jgi:transposase
LKASVKRHALDKKGKTVIDGVTAYSSRKCSECGEIVEKFANIEFVCPNGHNFDRDFNAAQNLLNQCKGDYFFVKGDEIEIPNQANKNLSRILIKV